MADDVTQADFAVEDYFSLAHGLCLHLDLRWSYWLVPLVGFPVGPVVLAHRHKMDHAEEQAGEMEALQSIYEGELEGEARVVVVSVSRVRLNFFPSGRSWRRCRRLLSVVLALLSGGNGTVLCLHDAGEN